MIYFLLTFFVLHISVNFYIGYRGYQALEFFPMARPYLIILLIILTFAYPIGVYFERKILSIFTLTIHWMGAIWFAFMLYITLSLFLVDIFRVVNHFIPMVYFTNIVRTKQIAFYFIVSLSSLLILSGYINSWFPKVKTLTIEIPKKARKTDEYHIVAASDIHLGSFVRKHKVKKLVDKINELSPDIVLFAGDVVDSEPKPVINQNLGVYFNDIDSKYGVYAVTGNHEYIGDAEKSIAYLTKKGINFLRDSSILIDDEIYIVGREDIHKTRMNGQNRKHLAELLDGVDMTKAIVLLDHQPYNLGEVVKYPVDIQLSGHTHHGQMWPASYITKAMFEVSRGYKKILGTHFYVSSGYGTWGPPIRIGSRPEIISIKMIFTAD